jgi:hypothetical protein
LDHANQDQGDRQEQQNVDEPAERVGDTIPSSHNTASNTAMAHSISLTPRGRRILVQQIEQFPRTRGRFDVVHHDLAILQFVPEQRLIVVQILP